MKFSFGQNWLSFSRTALDTKKVGQARAAFAALTNGIDLKGKRFLDIGFGQGLALFLAAERGGFVYGLDADPFCENALAETARFFPGISRPSIRIGSILDPGVVEDLRSAGPFDIVHSWGALHHTGDMTTSLRQAGSLVSPGGYFLLSIYNRHWTSPLWRIVKWVFNHLSRSLQGAVVGLAYPLFTWRARRLAVNGEQTTRGMEVRHDLRDWLGGYPYEYASPAQIADLMKQWDFVLIRCDPTRGFTGCNEFVLQRRTT